MSNELSGSNLHIWSGLACGAWGNGIITNADIENTYPNLSEKPKEKAIELTPEEAERLWELIVKSATS